MRDREVVVFGLDSGRALESVRGRDVFDIQSLHADREQSSNDKLCRLLFFIAALKDASASRVTFQNAFRCRTELGRWQARPRKELEAARDELAAAADAW